MISTALYLKVMVVLSIITIGVLAEYINEIMSRPKTMPEEEIW